MGNKRYYSYSGHKRTNVSVPLILFSVVCWTLCYVVSAGFPVYGEVLSTPIWNYLTLLMPGKFVVYLIGFALTLGGAFLLQRANFELGLIRERNYLPFLIYLALISASVDFIPINVASLGVFFLIVSLYELFTSYHYPNRVGKAFNASFLIGAGSLFWIHIVWLLPLFWYGMYRFRSFSLKSMVASLLGIMTVYWLLLGWCVWVKDFTLLALPLESLTKFGFFSFQISSLSHLIVPVVLLVLSVAAIINLVSTEYEDSIVTREFMWFLVKLFFFSLALYVLYGMEQEEFLQLSYVPASLLIARFVTVAHGKYYRWLFGISLLLLIVGFSLRIIELWSI